MTGVGFVASADNGSDMRAAGVEFPFASGDHRRSVSSLGSGLHGSVKVVLRGPRPGGIASSLRA